MARYQNRQKGFTLIELMIVVVIIGIVSSMAIPRFMKATTKSKQSEAKQILKQIYVMQRAYRQEHDTYCCNGESMGPNTGSIPTLGVETMESAKYNYLITVTDAIHFTATATANLDDDEVIDTWTVDETGDIVCTINDANSATL